MTKKQFYPTRFYSIVSNSIVFKFFEFIEYFDDVKYKYNFDDFELMLPQALSPIKGHQKLQNLKNCRVSTVVNVTPELYTVILKSGSYEVFHF